MAGPTTTRFRDGLLTGRTVLVAPGDGVLAKAVADTVRDLGARVEALDAADLLDEPATREAVGSAAKRAGGLATVVVDAASLFEGGLRPALDGAWVLARAAATEAMIGSPEGGKLVVIAPAPDRGDHAEAVRAGLENLARTLSIEWARHQIRATAIAPGPETAPEEIASLVAYLASPAGDYFSGACFSLS